MSSADNQPEYTPRDEDAYARAYLSLLPDGAAWPKGENSLLGYFAKGLTKVIARFDRAVFLFLLREADPRTAFFTLSAWEREVGLPDPCFPTGSTVEERRAAVTAKWTARGGASRPYFIGLATRLGYIIEIEENAVGIFGVTPFGSGWRFGADAMRFWWRVRVTGPRLTYFRFGISQFGADPHLRIRRAEDLECLFNRLKPSHTQINFIYEGI